MERQNIPTFTDKYKLYNTEMQRRLNRNIQIAIHILIWGSTFTLVLTKVEHLGSFKKEDGSIYIPLIYGLLTNLILFYTNASYLIPKYLPSRRIQAYIVMVLLLFFGITIIETAFDHLMSVNIYSSEEEPLTAKFILNLIINGMFLSLSMAYGFINNWIITENQKQKLVKEKLSAELNYLKAQVNPHFLFNALNMAYASAIKHEDVVTADIIEKLSGLLRYNLYECNDAKVELEKELHYIENYINLQERRLSEDIRQYLKIHIDKPTSLHKIAPLLLIPFVENVFKHGILLSNQGEIEISIKIDDNQLNLFTKNPITPHHIVSDYGNIGIKNVKAQLDLLYKNKHSLSIKKDGNYYIAELCIHL